MKYGYLKGILHQRSRNFNNIRVLLFDVVAHFKIVISMLSNGVSEGISQKWKSGGELLEIRLLDKK
jgi:hypothetical protein